MDTKVVAVHQPNYFPWLGYFEKIARSDVFVLLDDVQIGSRSLLNRVFVQTPAGQGYLRVPLRRHHRQDPINTVHPSSDDWQAQGAAMLEFYKNAPHFDACFPAVRSAILDCHSGQTIAEINTSLLKRVCGLLNVDTEFVNSSDLGVASGKAQRMIDITKAVGGSVYYSGTGARGYQREADFQAAGLTLVYQDFHTFMETHPYEQHQGREFIHGLSVLDAMFNIGADGIQDLLVRAGRRKGSAE